MNEPETAPKIKRARESNEARQRRVAIRPRQYSWRDWWHAIVNGLRGMDELNIALIAAGIAFFGFLSVFPAMAALIAIWGFMADPAMIQEQLQMAQDVVPEGAYGILSDQVAALVGANRSALQWTSIVSIVLAIWSARAAVAALIRGLNAIYREPHRGNFFRRTAAAVGLTALLILVALIAFAAVVLIPAILSFLRLSAWIEVPITMIKWVVLLGVVFFAIALLYRYGPNRRQARLQWLTPGAVVAVTAWTIGSLGLAMYVRSFSNLNEVYGSLGAVVALLFWFYLSALVTLIGALLNAELELLTARDSTIGPERPPGTRDAYVADCVVGESGVVEPCKEISTDSTQGAAPASGPAQQDDESGEEQTDTAPRSTGTSG